MNAPCSEETLQAARHPPIEAGRSHQFRMATYGTRERNTSARKTVRGGLKIGDFSYERIALALSFRALKDCGERRTVAQKRLRPMENLRFRIRPMSAPKTTVAMIAAPCAPSACHGVETGHAMRQPALIARPAPAPYRAPATVGRIASEFRNIQLKNRTRIPPASVLPIPQVKFMIQGETRRVL